MHQYNPNKHHRRSIRLKGYDYSQEGLYFITLCCHDRNNYFGFVEHGNMVFSEAGKIAHECWLDIPNHFPNTVLHEFVIMPNHVHGIIEIVPSNDPLGAKNLSPNSKEITNNDSKEFQVISNNSSQIDKVTNINTEDKRANINTEGNKENINSADTGANINREDKRAKDFSPQRFQSPSRTIGSIVRGYKIGVTKWMRQNTSVYSVWQRNYYEHIIRNEQAYRNISDYIINNPKKWQEDKFHHQ